MYFSSILTAALIAVSATAAPTAEPTDLTERQSTANIGLYIPGGGFDLNYLQTFHVSYANTSAYVGAIKYQSYSEPLVVGALSGPDNSVSFLSIHSSPTGFQQMYVVPHQSQPVGFSVPHGGAPSGARTGGFSFGPRGALLNNGHNLFYACQNAETAALNSYQIYWLAAGTPQGMTCKGPIKIQSGDACSRY